MAEQLSREEAVQYLTGQQDKFEDAKKDKDLDTAFGILEQTGDRIGYAPTFRCLVKGLTPEDSIRWGK